MLKSDWLGDRRIAHAISHGTNTTERDMDVLLKLRYVNPGQLDGHEVDDVDFVSSDRRMNKFGCEAHNDTGVHFAHILEY